MYDVRCKKRPSELSGGHFSFYQCLKISRTISRDNYPTSRQLSTQINSATMRMRIKSAVPRQHFIPESTEGTQALYEGITFERERD